MKNKKMLMISKYGAVLVVMVLALCTFTSCKYLKMNPPPDADKTWVSDGNTCWLATAANMLAGAGYGTGTSVQERAQSIYDQLKAHFGNVTGWTDTAISWWLGSAHNTWTTNPYSVVTVYGNKSPKNPWANPNGAQFIANELRRCQMVGLSISWPTDAPGVVGSGGHAITAWGDNMPKSASVSSNPSGIRVTDSDTETGGDIQDYTYDSYTGPNPGGPNEGNGWYFNYDPNHPYIKHIVTLCPTTNAAGNVNTQKVTGSLKIHQDNKTDATDLHYVVYTDVRILTYLTSINWVGAGSPTIKEGGSGKELTVDWDLKEKPIPYCNDITITTEFILPYYNSIYYKNVHFTYPEGEGLKKIPEFGWIMKSPKLNDSILKLPDITGGYVIGKFDLLNVEKQLLGQYRFVHEYSYDQAPEEHFLGLKGEKEYFAANFAFGHSYGYVEKEELWEFENWMTTMNDIQIQLGDTTELKIDWKGRLPYPRGEDIEGRIKEIKPRNK